MDTGVTIPPAVMVAEVLPRLHTPPEEASENADDDPRQRFDGPVMVPAAGKGLTVIVAVLETEPHALVTVYEISVVPTVTPVTVPEVPTVAIAVAPELHTPPVTTSVSVTAEPWQTVDGPETVPAVRNAPMLMVLVVTAVPHELVTV